jgi:diguanylate cyclase (GGDEF)-like protein
MSGSGNRGPAGTTRLSSIVTDDLLQGVVAFFQERTGVRVWFQDASGYTIAPETQVPAYCSILINHGRCGLNNPEVDMPPSPDLAHFRTCVGGIGHLVIPIRHRTARGGTRELGRLITEPMAIRETTYDELLAESRRLHSHPDTLSSAAGRIPLVSRDEVVELTRIVTLVLQRVADDRSDRARHLAVAEAFEEVGMLGNQEVIRELLAALVRDFSDADAVILTTQGADEDAFQHQQSFDDGLTGAERELLLAFTNEVVRWISQTGYPISFPDLGGSSWRRHVLAGTALEGALVSVPVKLPGNWRGWWTAYYRKPMASMEDQLHRLSVLAAHSTQTLTFVAQLEASQEAALTDALTRLGNRRFLHEQLEREIARSHRSRYPVSMVILDIDDFKSINDTYGHREGDEALKVVADALRVPLRRSSTVCRYGGDEFCVIIPECSPEEALGVARRLREEVAQRPLTIAGMGQVTLRISAGVATQDPAAPATADLFELADQALIQAKRAGKDRVQVSQGSVPQLMTDEGRVV